jgi:hypothetical protein
METDRRHPAAVRITDAFELLARKEHAVTTPTVTAPLAKISPGAFRGVLGLLADASDAQVIAETRRVEETRNPTPAELNVRVRLRSVAGLDTSASTAELLAAVAAGLETLRASNAPAAMPAAVPSGTAGVPTPFEQRIAAAMGLPADSSSAVIHANVKAIGARLRIDQAIAERRVHRSQRTALFGLAISDFAAFDAAVSSQAIVGYPTASEEFAALMQQQRVALEGEGRRDAATFAMQKTSRDYPELAREAAAERRGVNRAEVERAGLAADIVVAVRKFTAAGKTWHEAIKLVADENPELVRAYGRGTEAS